MLRATRTITVALVFTLTACVGPELPLEPAVASANVKPGDGGETVGYDIIDLGGAEGNQMANALGIDESGEALIRVTTDRGNPVATYVTFHDALRKLPGFKDAMPPEALRIGGRGDVAGFFRPTLDPWAFGQNAFFWRGNGQATDLGPATWSNYDNYTLYLNDRGQVAYVAMGVDENSTAYFHTYVAHGNSVTDLGALPGSHFSYPGAINNRGDVAGTSIMDAFSHRRGFLWRDGVMIDIGSINGSTYTEPRAMNENGQIAGASLDATGRLRLFLWDNGAMTEIGASTFYLERSSRVDINNAGRIVATSSSSFNRAYTWTAQGGLTDLGSLGGVRTLANDLNDAGQIVGWSEVDANYTTRAFVWQNGVMTDLGTLGGWFSMANAINEDGIIVGQSVNAAGQIRATMWRPRSLRRK